MRIDIVSPVSPSSTRGNGVTARRWAGILEKLGHSVSLSNSFDNAIGPETNCVIGIHATRCSAIMQAISEQRPDVALVVCLSGTDLNRDLAKEESDNAWQRASRCLTLADKIVLLEPVGYQTIRNESLRKTVETKSTVIFQSALPLVEAVPKRSDAFEVSVIGHLRPVKDPFRTALAASQLPDSSNIKVVHFGQALSDEMFEQAITMDKSNARYCWVGNRSHVEAMRQLVRSQATVLSSVSEGAPSLISEAVVNSVPILATRIPATIGLLGSDYPGFYDVYNTDQLASLLLRLETEPKFGEELKGRLDRIKDRFAPEQEEACWRDLLSSLSGERGSIQ